MPFAGLLRRGTSFFSNNSSNANEEGKVTKDTLFPLVTCEHEDKKGDDDCDHDCAACPIPADGTSGYGKAFDKIGVDHSSELWGGVKKYSRHVIVATGETDWIRDVEDIKGSVMEALKKRVGKGVVEDRDGKLMISASNMPPPNHHHHTDPNKPQPTTVLLLPSWTVVENVTPETTPELISRFINPSPTTLDPLQSPPPPAAPTSPTSPLTLQIPPISSTSPSLSSSPTKPTPGTPITPSTPIDTTALQNLTLADVPYSCESTLSSSPFPHDTLILLCSHKHRDARCGISAPILRKEFERHLRPLGLWRDMADTRAGGVKVLFINHVGGHRWAANVLIYRRGKTERGENEGEAVQGIWLAKVTPRHVEGIVRHTVLEGRVCDSGLIRAGFDRGTGLSSW